MTREEKAQEFARNCAEYNNLPIEVEHLLHTAFIVGYNEREDEEKNPWHKASEELPKRGGRYLCMDENRHVVELAFCGTKWVNSTQYFDVCLDAVLYWMEIPEIKED